MKFLSRMLAAAMLAALAGCGLGGTFLVDPFLDEEISGEDFTAELARQYQRRTGIEKNVDYEWVHAGRLARKGYAAMSGDAVLPWDPADWNVRPNDMADLQAARARLLSALDGGGRQRFPEACAKAQVYYDGWLEQAHDNDFGDGFEGPVQPDYAASEKAAFYEIVSFCEGVIDPNKFVIYFGWNKFNLTEAALELIGEIAEVADRFDAANVLVEGHADTSGSARYNMGLAEKRARAVADALQDEGVTVTGVRWFGEVHPAVPRGDSVREPLNRRVEVTLTR
jgi:outer membrane protein OmpA-like peptidoglycan-associated protein